MPIRIEGVFAEEEAGSPGFHQLAAGGPAPPELEQRAAFLEKKFDLRKEKASNPQSNDRCALAN